jgi:hypothetical protein
MEPATGTIDPDPVPGALEVLEGRSSSFGRRAFLAGAVGTAAGVALADQVDAIEPGASAFVPLAPARLIDTRTRSGALASYQRLDGNTVRFQVAGKLGVPANAVAVVVTLTCVNTKPGRNFAALYPSGSSFTGTSSLNCQYQGDVVANLVTVKLGTAPKGWLDARTNGPANVIVDVAGYYLPVADKVREGRFRPVDPVIRAVDTRKSGRKPGAGSVVTVNLNGIVGSDAVAVVANLTVVEANRQGFCTAFPIGGTLPATSNINLGPGQTRAVGIMTKLGFDAARGIRGINVFTQRGAHVIVDVAGYITGPSESASSSGLFVPINPTRIMDTRGSKGVKKRLWPGWTRAITLPAAFAGKSLAAVTNLTVTQTMGKGFFTIYAAQTVRREVSNLNVAGPNQTVANHAVVRNSTKGIAVYAHKGGHVIIDLMGWYTGVPQPSSTFVPIDPPPPPGPLPWVLQVPRMGLGHWVFEGLPDPIVDGGNSWHWTGTGLVGQRANVVTFGHRTSAGGPYRPQHLLVGGDLLYVTTADRRVYTYRYAYERLTDANTFNILNATRVSGVETFALVSCTGDGATGRLSDQPGARLTSVRWRLVTVFSLVSWADLG